MFRLTDDEFNNPSIDTLAILPPNVRDDILRNAIKNNNTKIVQLALELGCDPNISFEYYDICPDGNKYFEFSPTALDVAVIQKHPLLFKIIYERGGLFNLRGRVFGNKDIMNHLCKNDDFSCLSVLISQMPHIDSPYSKNEETLLSGAASVQNKKAIEYLLAHGADINGRLYPESAFIHKVHVYNSAITGVPPLVNVIETLEFLESMGASLEGINDNYLYPYEIAAYKIPHPSLLEYFLNKGIDLKRSGRDALLSAAKGSLENVKFLIGLNHSVDVTNTRGQTPLDIAILYYQKNVIEFLLSKDAPFNYEKAIEKISSPEILNLIQR